MTVLHFFIHSGAKPYDCIVFILISDIQLEITILK
jgi:hypothetical protein